MPRRFLDQRLKLPLLRVADALDTHGSLLKASAALGLGQPALTRSLRELEEITGAALFERHPRGVRPTAAGVAVIRVARRVLGELRRMKAELDALGDPEAGSVAVGVLPVAAVGVLPGTLIALRAARPGLRVNLHQRRTEELLPMLASRELDLIVGRLYAPAVPDGLQRLPMWEEPIAALARSGHPLLRRCGRAVTAAALAGYEMVLPTVSQRVGQEIEHLLALLGLPQDVPLRSSSYGFIREMLLASDAVSLHAALHDGGRPPARRAPRRPAAGARAAAPRRGHPARRPAAHGGGLRLRRGTARAPGGDRVARRPRGYAER